MVDYGWHKNSNSDNANAARSKSYGHNANDIEPGIALICIGITIVVMGAAFHFLPKVYLNDLNSDRNRDSRDGIQKKSFDWSCLLPDEIQISYSKKPKTNDDCVICQKNINPETSTILRCHHAAHLDCYNALRKSGGERCPKANCHRFFEK